MDRRFKISKEVLAALSEVDPLMLHRALGKESSELMAGITTILNQKKRGRASVEHNAEIDRKLDLLIQESNKLSDLIDMLSADIARDGEREAKSQRLLARKAKRAPRVGGG